jgi:hypothetical protein
MQNCRFKVKKSVPFTSELINPTLTVDGSFLCPLILPQSAGMEYGSSTTVTYTEQSGPFDLTSHKIPHCFPTQKFSSSLVSPVPDSKFRLGRASMTTNP